MNIPSDIAENPVKRECWEQIAAAVEITNVQLPVVRMICNWSDIAETALAEIGNGKEGARQIIIEVPTQGGGVRDQKAPALDVYKDACVQIMKLRADIGLSDSESDTQQTKSGGKETTLNVIQCKFDRMQGSKNSRQA